MCSQGLGLCITGVFMNKSLNFKGTQGYVPVFRAIG